MPLPKPKDDETQGDFISRCMSDDVAKEEVPDNDQRLAMCYRLWDERSAPVETSPFERRYYAAVEIRLKEPEDTESNAITGYAAVFNSWSEDLGFFKEQIAPGAFARTIKNGDVRALINHDPNERILPGLIDHRAITGCGGRSLNCFSAGLKHFLNIVRSILDEHG